MNFNGFITKYRKVITTVGTLILIQLLIALIGFFTRIKVANILGSKNYGDMSFGIAIGSYVAAFVHFGLDKSLVRDLIHNRDRFGEVLRISLGIKIFLFVVAFLCFLFIRPFLNQDEFSLAIFLIAVATTCQAFNLQPAFDVKTRSKEHSLYSFLERVVYFSCIWTVVILPFFVLTLNKVGMFMLAAVFVGLCLQYWAARTWFVTGTKSISRIEKRHFIGANVWIWFAVLFSLSIDWLTPIVLKFFNGSKVLGSYGAAWLIVQVGIMSINQIGRLGVTALARFNDGHIDYQSKLKFLFKYLIVMLAAGTSVGVPCILFAEKIIGVFTNEYVDASSVLRILGFYPILFGPYLVFLQQLICSRKQKTYFLLIAISGLMSAALSVVLIPRYGAIGAAYSVILSISFALILFSIAVTKTFVCVTSYPPNRTN